MLTVGERLRKARLRKGLKQVQVKERTGINNKTLSGYENNVSEPDLDTLKILANLYEVSVDWLTGMESHNKNTYNLEDLSENRKKMVEEVWKMKDEDVQYFYDLMKRLKK